MHVLSLPSDRGQVDHGNRVLVLQIDEDTPLALRRAELRPMGRAMVENNSNTALVAG